MEALERADSEEQDACRLPETKSVKPQVRAKRKVQYVEEKMRRTFIEVAGLESIEETLDFSPKQIEELVLEFPQYAMLLVQDLMVFAVEKIVETEQKEEEDVEISASQSNLLQ
jgi:hypothetical protein